MEKWLENALDFGLSEEQFWNMTLAEIQRFEESKLRTLKREQQTRASFDYIQSIIIIKGFRTLLDKTEKVPSMEEAYNGLFNEEKTEETKQEKLDNISAIRFKQFANSLNKKLAKEKEVTRNE